ncbi:unnamed protein product, partial [Penicillium nalgiovense]
HTCIPILFMLAKNMGHQSLASSLTMKCPEFRPDSLPSDLLCRVVGFLPAWEIEKSSCVDKRLREVSLPVLSRAVRVEYSKASLNGLKRLTNSDIRQQVASLTYIAPETLKPDILDPGCFSSELLTPDDYIDWAFSHDIRSDECPSYILVRDVLRDMCEEQRYIMETALDKAALSSILTSLPRLETVNL